MERCATLPIAAGSAVLPPANSLPAEGGVNGMGRVPQPWDGTQPECIGLAATQDEVFASVYSQNIIQVLDVATGQPTRTLACYRPRGLALDAKGNLYAVCCGTDQAAADRPLQRRAGRGRAGRCQRTRCPGGRGGRCRRANRTSPTKARSQQIKTFSADGKLLRTLGKEGGRPWAGKYDPTSYRDPVANRGGPAGRTRRR